MSDRPPGQAYRPVGGRCAPRPRNFMKNPSRTGSLRTDFLWGRLPTCGRLVFGLSLARKTAPRLPAVIFRPVGGRCAPLLLLRRIVGVVHEGRGRFRGVRVEVERNL